VGLQRREAHVFQDRKKISYKNMKHSNKKIETATHTATAPDQKTIEHRAYELYVSRGSGPGHDSEDWLQAEAELKQRGGANVAPIAV
jgi:hypothetical protein